METNHSVELLLSMARAEAMHGTPPARGEPDIAVLIVDDQPAYRTAMREVVEATPGLRIAGEADSGEAAIAAAQDLSVQLVIVDKRMPGMSGFETCRAITERHPGIAVVVCSVEDPDPVTGKAHGAAAVMRKQDLSRDRLLGIVRARAGSESRR
jgi:DNA-binding NarL/FixJ family response regulator